MQWVSGWVVALSVAFVVVAGCSSHSRLNGEVQATPTSGSPPRASSSPGTMTSNVPSSGGVQGASTSGPMRTGSSEGVFIPADFVGMWDYYEGANVPHAALEGVLLVEGPCVYIIDDKEGYYPEIPLEDIPEPTVYFIELPRNRTWYDPDTQSIWSWDHGPMTNGDRVVVGGGGEYANPPDVCSDADSVWFGSGMSPAPCVAWLSPERYTGCRPEDLLAGMWNYNPARPSYAPVAEGVLLIKGPCVYVIDDFAWLVPSVPWDELPEPIRVFVNLPRAQTRYDPDTETIWVGDEGPMASGDRVELAGGAGQNLPDDCSADVTRVFTATHVSPKQCEPWVPSERQTGCKPAEAP